MVFYPEDGAGQVVPLMCPWIQESWLVTLQTWFINKEIEIDRRRFYIHCCPVSSPGVNPRIIRVSTTCTPWDHTNEGAVATLISHHGSTTVTLVKMLSAQRSLIHLRSVLRSCLVLQYSRHFHLPGKSLSQVRQHISCWRWYWSCIRWLDIQSLSLCSL